MSHWSLIYDEFNPEEQGLREAMCTLGNGYFATRGAGTEAVADPSGVSGWALTRYQESEGGADPFSEAYGFGLHLQATDFRSSALSRRGTRRCKLQATVEKTSTALFMHLAALDWGYPITNATHGFFHVPAMTKGAEPKIAFTRWAETRTRGSHHVRFRKQ